MNWRWLAALPLLLVTALAAGDGGLGAQNEKMFEQLRQVHGLNDQQMRDVRAVFTRSGFAGQGNPAVSEHPQTPQQCQDNLARQAISYSNPRFEKICHGKFMAPLYDPKTQQPEDAKACIDQFEFPNIPCSYPVVWVRAKEAAEICAAEGKRLCDAHEWEGSCAGRLEPPDYRFDLASGQDPSEGLRRMRAAHNRAEQSRKTWSYGPAYQTGICAAASHKTPGCSGEGWKKCGSNSYPAGSFPNCRSPLGVYDLNGNAAEHMNLPLSEAQMSSAGSQSLGYTEMKGSWFIFDRYHAHEDWCRWRAPFWHGSRVMDKASHANYHLGFRCCKDP